MKLLAEEGARRTFYDENSPVVKAIVDAVRNAGGVLSAADMANHRSTPVSPIFADFHSGKSSVRLWEIPPNGQGITALIALNILQNFVHELEGMTHNSAEYLHLLIEAL